LLQLCIPQQPEHHLLKCRWSHPLLPFLSFIIKNAIDPFINGTTL
jgi:hypothetical protein